MYPLKPKSLLPEDCFLNEQESETQNTISHSSQITPFFPTHMQYSSWTTHKYHYPTGRKYDTTKRYTHGVQAHAAEDPGAALQ